MVLLALALAPAIAIIFYIIGKDKYNKEPFINLLISFLLGVASTLPAILIQSVISDLLKSWFVYQSILYTACFAFFAVGLSEEGSKYLMLRYYAYRQKAFDEPLDGIIYGVMVSMGFATLENILYVSRHGFETAILRMFLSVPAHACFGVIMGYYVGLAKFNKNKARFYKRVGLILAILFHGAFDFFLFLQQNEQVLQYVSSTLLIIGALSSYYLAIRLSLRSIRLHQELSRIEYERTRNFF
jgi:RsiW-degrading membrane proteinase PrsW (M82 family)